MVKTKRLPISKFQPIVRKYNVLLVLFGSLASGELLVNKVNNDQLFVMGSNVVARVE